MSKKETKEAVVEKTKAEETKVKDTAAKTTEEALSPWYVFCSQGCGFCKKAEPVVEEKTEFNLFLLSIGSKKINVIKEVRAITGLGLKEAKDLVEAAPKQVKASMAKKEAEEAKKKLEAAGAKVELK